MVLTVLAFERVENEKNVCIFYFALSENSNCVTLVRFYTAIARSPILPDALNFRAIYHFVYIIWSSTDSNAMTTCFVALNSKTGKRAMKPYA